MNGLRRRWEQLPYWAKIALITVAAGVLRGAFLVRQPLWRDEAFTALTVQYPVGPMLDIVRQDSAPPLAYLATHAVTTAFATPLASPSASLWALRSVSLLAGVIVIPIVASLGRRINAERGGIWSALTCALLPTLVISSRDARMYAPAAMLVAAAALALWRYIERNTWTAWFIYALLVAVALQTEYFAAPAIAAIGVGSLIALRPHRRHIAAIVAADILGAASLVPWLLSAQAQFRHTATPFWVEPLGIKTIFGTYVQLFSGTPIDPGTPLKLPLQALQGVAIAVGTIALVALYRKRGSLHPTQRSAALFLAIAGGGGTVLLAIASLWRPLLEARYASVGWTPAMVLIGCGISLIDRNLIRAGACAGLATATLALSIAVVHPDTEPVIAYLDTHLNGGGIAAAPSQYLLLRFYGDAQVRSKTHVVSDFVPWYWGTAVYPPDAVVKALPLTNPGAPILSVDDVGDPPTTPPQGYRKSAIWCVTGTCVTTYSAG